jgi:hypothetical protein
MLFEASRDLLVRHVIPRRWERGGVGALRTLRGYPTAYQASAAIFRGADERPSTLRDRRGGAGHDDPADVNVSMGMQRCAMRQCRQEVQHERIESEALELHEKVRQGYWNWPAFPGTVPQGTRSLAETIAKTFGDW